MRGGVSHPTEPEGGATVRFFVLAGWAGRVAACPCSIAVVVACPRCEGDARPVSRAAYAVCASGTVPARSRVLPPPWPRESRGGDGTGTL